MNKKDFSRELIPAYILNFVTVFGVTLSLSFLPIYLNQLNISLVEIGIIFAIASIVAGIARFPVGHLVESYGRKPLLLIGAIGYPIFAIGLMLADTTSHFVALKLLLEITVAIFWTAMYTHLYDIFKKKRAGRQLAIRNITSGLAAILAPVTAGFVIITYGFIPLFITSAVVGVTALFIIAFFIKESRPNRRRVCRGSRDDRA